MPIIDITRWDAVISKGNTQAFPMIYVKSNATLLDMARNQKELSVRITDSRSGYDQRVFKGVIDSSAFYPNYRPYFYNATNDLVITLITNWRGYPLLNGKANVFVQEIESESVSFYPVLPTPSGPDYMPLISKN